MVQKYGSLEKALQSLKDKNSSTEIKSNFHPLPPLSSPLEELNKEEKEGKEKEKEEENEEILEIIEVNETKQNFEEFKEKVNDKEDQAIVPPLPIILSPSNNQARVISPPLGFNPTQKQDEGTNKVRSSSLVDTSSFQKKMAEAQNRKEKSPKKKGDGKKGFGKLFLFKREKEEDKKEKQEIMAFLYGNE